MNKKKLLRIYLAQISDLPNLIDYIHREWSEHHILTRDRDCFVYQYKKDQQLNFVIARDDEENVVGMLGFIPANSENFSDV